MDFLANYFLFFLKLTTIVVALVMILIVLKSGRDLKKKKGEIQFDDLSDAFEELKASYQDLIEDEAAEDAQKPQKKWWQFWKKSQETADSEKKTQPKLFVIDFDGDTAAHAAQNLKQEVNAILSVAKAEDEVLVRLTSPGGVVNGYGLAAAQLERFSAKQLNLTVAVDEVAASGGYLMACVADRIVAAPFAIIGSIGVVAQLPNFHRLLEKYNIDYEQFTAGKYKRTVTMFGENTEEGREKFKEELEDVHVIFKEYVAKHRPQVDIEKIATGEHWLGSQALNLNLVDALQTSDDYLLSKLTDFRVIHVAYVERKSLRSGMLKMLAKLQARFSY
ncbi:protease SohB [Wohlfahrtiimonas chitiniclastica]|uniref:Putative protease SohB n=1 Tax=Wohlfahrtiimonas chitiniclastica SH04 TaxID=1261130 RepID=L8Y1C3_9GAMM|nr:protease SohB [Wohlfahrtiimonas chitiniclastica]ELV08301.1 Putative protease SohB [Wohlfahrtiimonas chitiniclastica SH04]MBS7816787.1 protease SohB [Wohlfahrtiimonas chitiniclastica]MBS7822320.1 protease SohB [Wohlfahrtiimonas chitiniclastica]MBS7830382.1 protease SohB [Wohlfahrtiimonas chitiniclastica]MBS7832350.1 protease SohB [Wohlfahrtiimonas chitiniclastica]